jgi:hypothetical protein
MNRFSFWQKWLVIVSLAITCFGLFMALFSQAPLFDIFSQQIDPAFWPEAPDLPGLKSFQAWLYGVWGATIAGWGLFLVFITGNAFKKRKKWTWNCLVVGLGAWFVLDTWLSWRFAVTFNMFFNIVVVLATGTPLVFTRKAFFDR